MAAPFDSGHEFLPFPEPSSESVSSPSLSPDEALAAFFGIQPEESPSGDAAKRGPEGSLGYIDISRQNPKKTKKKERTKPQKSAPNTSVIVRRVGKAVYLSRGYFEGCAKLKGGKRKEITGFTWKSMKKFCDLLVSFDHDRTVEKWGGCNWITLTFDGTETGAERAKAHLDNVLNHVIPRMQGVRAPRIWKAELQKRGTIHFHLLVYGPEVCQDDLAKKWHRITGSTQDAHLEHGVDVAPVPDHKRLRCYLAKYLTKEVGCAKKWDLGRVWGVRDKKGLVFHEQVEVELDLPLSKTIKACKQMGIQVPTSIYDLEEWLAYVDAQLALPLEARVGYYQFRAQEAAKRKEAESQTDKQTDKLNKHEQTDNCQDSPVPAGRPKTSIRRSPLPVRDLHAEVGERNQEMCPLLERESVLLLGGRSG